MTHARGRCLPEHGHERAYVSLLVAGHYAERIQGREFLYRPMDAVFHPLGALHSDTVGNDGATFICVEFLQPQIEAHAGREAWRPQLVKADMAVLMIRLAQHLRQGTLCQTIVESSVYELLGTLADTDLKREERLPRWLRHCIEHLDAEYHSPVTVRDLAAQLGVHPVHLAREFRRRFGETVGEYVNKIRVQSACSRILKSDAALADVATASGFYDQSHFVRVFRATVGCTPSEFRRFHAA